MERGDKVKIYNCYLSTSIDLDKYTYEIRATYIREHSKPGIVICRTDNGVEVYVHKNQIKLENELTSK